MKTFALIVSYFTSRWITQSLLPIRTAEYGRLGGGSANATSITSKSSPNNTPPPFRAPMAEAIGVASGIAGLVTIADIIVRKGYRFIKNVKEAEESVTKLVEEVNNLSGVLHSLNNFVEIFEEDDANHDPTIQIHSIEACFKTLTKIKNDFDQAMPTTLLSKLDKMKWHWKSSHAKELLLEIERHKATMTLAMTAKQMSGLLEILAQQHVVRQSILDIRISLEQDRKERREAVISEERRKLLEALGDIEAQKWQDSNIRMRQPGTGIWFTDGSEFKTWISTEKSKLWIHGIAGAGKTLLMASTIQEVEKSLDRSHAVAFFYCDYKSPQTHDPLSILGSLARQLILQDARGYELLSKFVRIHTSNNETSSHTAEDVCDLIRSLSKHWQSALIIVDGLDEITNDRAEVTQLLASLNTSDGCIKTLFASRLEVDIGYQLEGYDQVSIVAKSSDLRLYVASEIEKRTRQKKLRIRDPDLKDHIMETLVDGADGMFRWVACQIDYLCECNNDRDRREALQKLPPDLPSSYERILERVNRSNKENQDLVTKTLHWIFYARRTLSTDQLLQALAVREGEEFFDPSAITTEEELLLWCSSLVRKNTTTGELELAHFTVEEFLQSDELAQKQYLSPYHLSGDETVLAKACLGFLNCRKFGELGAPGIRTNQDEFWIMWDTISEAYSLLAYACEHVIDHVHKSKWANIDVAVWKIFESVDVLNFWTCGWIRECYSHVASYVESSWPQCDQNWAPTSLHWAAVFALKRICSKLIADGADVCKPSAIGTPLHCTVLAEMAPKPFMPNTKPPSDWEEARLAVSWQEDARESVLKQLIEAGANTETVYWWQDDPWTPLELALYSDFGYEKPFRSRTLLKGSARLTKKCLSTLVLRFETNTSKYGFYDYEKQLQALSTKILSILSENRVEIQGIEVDVDVIALALYVTCSVGLSELVKDFQMSFAKIIPGIVWRELDEILNGGDSELECKIIAALSKALEIASPSSDDVHQIVQLAFDMAVCRRRASKVAFMLQSNEKLDAAHSFLESLGYGRSTALHFLLPGDDESDYLTMRAITEHSTGSIVAVPDDQDRTPIDFAARYSNLQTFQLLWNSAKKSNIWESFPTLLEDILHSAIKNESNLVFEFLIEELAFRKVIPGLDILEIGVLLESTKLLEVILNQYNHDRNQEPNSTSEDTQNETPVGIMDGNSSDSTQELRLKAFHLASLPQGSVEAFEFLSNQEFRDVSQPETGNTTLHALSQWDDWVSSKKMEIFLKLSPSLDLLNSAQLTPLALGIRCKNLSGMGLLLEAGSDVNTLLADNQTPLHIACCVGNKLAVATLLHRGCDTSIEDNNGHTPYSTALACGNDEIAQMIQNFLTSEEALLEQTNTAVEDAWLANRQ